MDSLIPHTTPVRTQQLSSDSVFANRFEIQDAVGSGGMGTVYRARDRYSGELVALKLLHASRSSSDESERFLREAVLLSELHHPGIVRHAAHGPTPDGQRFLAMEWLEGQDLGQRLSRGPLPVAACLRVLLQVADALSLAHGRGIIHRDLKPSNLFLVAGDLDRVKILDFGIARRVANTQAMTQTGVLVGTPEYMAPEQARGSRQLTPASDLFSLGCVLYECLAGQPPFAADHFAASLVQILFEDPVPIAERRPGISPAIQNLLARLLAKQPEQRLPDAAALLVELRALGDVPEPAPAVTLAGPSAADHTFAAQEQSLFCVVLAAPPEIDPSHGETPPSGANLLNTTDKQTLLQALSRLGAAPDILANGTLVVVVHPRESAHDQATIGARAALLIKERWPDAVVSMATGRGSASARMAVGDVVELAARSLRSGSLPASGQPISGVLIDPLSSKLLSGRFAQTSQTSGAVLHHEARDLDTSRSLLGKPTPCLGREPELGSLDVQLAACIDESEPRVVLVTASPGIGKSRLRHEFLQRIEKRNEGITVLLGRGEMMSAGAPYGILRDAIHKLCGIAGGEDIDIQRERLRKRVAKNLAPTESERVCLFVGELSNIPFPGDGQPMLQAARQDPKIMRDGLRRAFLDFLAAECAAAPVLLVLDDLQWGDELTVTMLGDALRELGGNRLFIFGLARPEVRKVFPKLWECQAVQELALRGLSKKACERLITTALGNDVSAGAIATMVEQCGGNALFLEEIIRSYADGNPASQAETIVAMLQARIGRLGGNARRALLAASIFGQTFWLRGVEAVLGQPADARDLQAWFSALVGAELIRPHLHSRLAGQTEYGFRHALLRDAAYGLLTDSDRRMGHRLAGHFLAAAGESNAALIAEHLERGDELQRAATFHCQAAEICLEQFDLAGVIRHVERGVRCAPESTVLGKLRCIECFAAFLLNQLDRVAAVAEEAIALAQPGSLDWCRAASGAYFAALIRQDIPRALEVIGLILATEPETNAQTIYLVGAVAILAILSVSAPVALLNSLLARITDCVERWAAKNPALRRYLYAAHAQLAVYRQPKPWTLVCEAENAIRLSREVGDSLIEIALNTHLVAWGWLDLGAREKTEAHLRAQQAVIAESQARAADAPFRCIFARVLADSSDEGAWNEAEQLLLPLLSMNDLLPLSRSSVEAILARLDLQRGRLASAAARLRGALDALPTGPAWLVPTATVQMRVLVALGRAEEATKAAEQMLAYFAVLGSAGVFEVEFRVAVSEAFLAAGDQSRAHAELRETLRQMGLRADDIADPFWKSSYLSRNPACVRAQQLAAEWGIAVASRGEPSASQ
jgi:hypothetical protein